MKLGAVASVLTLKYAEKVRATVSQPAEESVGKSSSLCKPL